MTAKKEICVLCAWREDCNKKFSISGRDISCPDFVRDLKTKEGEIPEGEAGGENLCQVRNVREKEV